MWLICVVIFWRYLPGRLLLEYLCRYLSESLRQDYFKQIIFWFAAAEPKVTPSPDGVITNESALKDFIRSVAVKEEPKKDLNTSSSNAVNQVCFWLLWIQVWRYNWFLNSFNLLNCTNWIHSWIYFCSAQNWIEEDRHFVHFPLTS